MSSSPEHSEFSGLNPTKLTEKPSFSQTCSLLSQYLKEKGSFGDLSLGMTCNTEANGTPELRSQTMSLFPLTDKPTAASGSRNMVGPCILKSMDLFPDQAAFLPSPPKQQKLLKMADSSVNKPVPGEVQTDQMTIFYGGKVLVFNHLPADKAKEIMLLASKESTQNYSAFTSNMSYNTQAAFSPKSVTAESSSSLGPSPQNGVPSFSNNTTQERIIQAPTASLGCELPIARRASLHRFLEKRKDRITGKAPYQMGNPGAGACKPEESKSWLGLAAQSPQ